MNKLSINFAHFTQNSITHAQHPFLVEMITEMLFIISFDFFTRHLTTTMTTKTSNKFRLFFVKFCFVFFLIFRTQKQGTYLKHWIQIKIHIQIFFFLIFFYKKYVRICIGNNTNEKNRGLFVLFLTCTHLNCFWYFEKICSSSSSRKYREIYSSSSRERNFV